VFIFLKQNIIFSYKQFIPLYSYKNENKLKNGGYPVLALQRKMDFRRSSGDKLSLTHKVIALFKKHRT
jgi:hypothetical protein